jgi:hypothetical protein
MVGNHFRQSREYRPNADTSYCGPASKAPRSAIFNRVVGLWSAMRRTEGLLVYQPIAAFTGFGPPKALSIGAKRLSERRRSTASFR